MYKNNSMTYCFLVQMILWTIFKLLMMIFGHGCTFQHLVFNGFYTFDLFDDAGAKRLIVDMNHFQFSAEF